MEIFIDESGSFTDTGANPNSWCVISAYTSPETEKRKYRDTLNLLKRRSTKPISSEIKLHEIEEQTYFQFLEELGQLKGALICIATDSHLNTVSLVKEHQRHQADSLLKDVDEMIYESGKYAVQHLANQVMSLSPQQYVQLTCQIQLIHSVINRGINYFIQRQPNTLASFRWRIDQKEPAKKLDYEDAFEKLSPALLQTISLREPFPALSWCDYRPMSEYMHKKGDIPEYLIDKFPHLSEAEGLDVQKIVRKDIKFVDSKLVEGVQVSDLLASGVRRLLKADFENNEQAAMLLGKLMVQEMDNKSPVSLITLGNEAVPDTYQTKLIRLLIKFCKPMVK